MSDASCYHKDITYLGLGLESYFTDYESDIIKVICWYLSNR